MYFQKRVFLILLSTLLMVLFMTKNSLAGDSNPIISRKVLFGNPEKASVMLSPDGKYISYLAPKNGVLNVWVAPKDDLSKAKSITNDRDRGIRQYFWSYDNNHILYMQDEKGDENFRLYSHDFKANSTDLLSPEKDVRTGIVKISHKFPNEILISSNERDKSYFDVYKLNLTTGKKELLVENNKFAGFVADHNLQVRFAYISTEDGGGEYFQLIDKEWQTFMKITAEDVNTTNIMGFDKYNNSIYLADSRARDTSALKIFNLATNEMKLIDEDDKADMDIFTIHPTEKTIQASQINYERSKYKILDNSIKDDLDYLSSIDSGELIINSRTLDDKNWLAAYLSDTGPVKYYTYDRELKKASYLFSNRSNLENLNLAKMNPVIIKSRDGLNLVSYLTFPYDTEFTKDLTPKNPLPLIIYVHGGPQARDDWGFNPVHQLFANRGYAVLSVNYRGSTGFGKNFINAGNLQWSRKMHDDLIDTVNWAVANNIAPKDKIAIMGGSYGGYATLVGLTFTPDIFACGIDIVGPSNLLTLVNSIPPYWKPYINDLKRRMGDWDTKEGEAFLKATSPLTYVDKITKPLFIAQGAHDPRVKKAEADQIYHQMIDKKIPVAYALYENEGHGFAKPENRLSFYAMSERFLSKILGGRLEEIGDDLTGSNFILNEKTISDNKMVEDTIDGAIK
jgi:dipeptidyl aminopeptidase/acylaminoacyl peptidase